MLPALSNDDIEKILRSDTDFQGCYTMHDLNDMSTLRNNYPIQGCINKSWIILVRPNGVNQVGHWTTVIVYKL